MNDQERRKKRIRHFALFCYLLYIPLAYFTLHFHHVIASSEEKLTIQNIKNYGEAALESIQSNVFVRPDKETFRIWFLELIAVTIYVFYKITTQKILMPGREHGTARWGGNAERKKIKDKRKDQNIILTTTERLGLDTKKTRKNLNILAIGGAGTGKSRFFVKPNILQANTSLVITDPKGELLRDTGPNLYMIAARVRNGFMPIYAGQMRYLCF